MFGAVSTVINTTDVVVIKQTITDIYSCICKAILFLTCVHYFAFFAFETGHYTSLP